MPCPSARLLGHTQKGKEQAQAALGNITCEKRKGSRDHQKEMHAQDDAKGRGGRDRDGMVLQGVTCPIKHDHVRRIQGTWGQQDRTAQRAI